MFTIYLRPVRDYRTGPVDGYEDVRLDAGAFFLEGTLADRTAYATYLLSQQGGHSVGFASHYPTLDHRRLAERRHGAPRHELLDDACAMTIDGHHGTDIDYDDPVLDAPDLLIIEGYPPDQIAEIVERRAGKLTVALVSSSVTHGIHEAWSIGDGYIETPEGVVRFDTTES